MGQLHAGLVVASLATTSFLTGLIWTIQIDGYPLFASVGRDAFTAFEADHVRRITIVVGPVMLLEALLTAAVVVDRPAVIPAWMAWVGAAIVVTIWASTALIQVPLHNRLARGFDVDAHGVLVATNWIRTAGWSVRTAGLAWATWQAIAPVAA